MGAEHGAMDFMAADVGVVRRVTTGITVVCCVATTGAIRMVSGVGSSGKNERYDDNCE